VRHIALKGHDECIQNVDRKPEWKIPIGRFRHRLKDNIKMELGGIGCEGVD
jgi:hypothetical protein